MKILDNAHRSRALGVAVAGFLACALLVLGTAGASAATRLQSGSFGTDGTAATQFADPYQLAFDQGGDRLLALDRGASEIHAFDLPAILPPGGNFPLAVGATSQFGGIAVDNTALASARNIYHSSAGAGAVSGFDSAGVPLGGAFPIVPPGFTFLCGAAVDSQGNIAVAAFFSLGGPVSNGILLYDTAGTLLNSIDTSAEGGPCHLAFDANDDLFVSHFTPLGTPDKVWKYTAASNYEGAAATIVDRRPTTTAIAVDRGAGILYAAHSDHVRAFKTDGTLLYEFGGDLAGADFQGIAVDEGTGTVYVSDTGAGSDRVRAFPPLTVQTGGTSEISDAGATLVGTLNIGAPLTECRFEYVHADAFQETGFADLSSGGSKACDQPLAAVPTDQENHQVSAQISRPAPGEAFYFRLVAGSAAGSAIGVVRAAGLAITGFDGEVLDEGGEAETQAGGHPHTAETEFSLSTLVGGEGRVPTEQFQDGVVELPPGFLGNPNAVPTTCTLAQLGEKYSDESTDCPEESQVGVVDIEVAGPADIDPVGVYRMKANEGSEASRIGAPAVFGFNPGVPVMVYGELRSGEDYGVNIISENAPLTVPLEGAEFVFWGVPADPAHDPERFCAGGNGKGCSSEAPLKPLITLPTSCTGPTETFFEAIGWFGSTDRASFISHEAGEPGNLVENEGCDEVPFSPKIEARPTTDVADSPSGLDVTLTIPQNEDCEPGPPVVCETATAHLRETTVTLPEGLVVNPSGANGLDGCSEEEFGFTGIGAGGAVHTTPDPADCPNASRVASVEVETPLVGHPLKGSAYVADPHENPFDSLLALYLAIDDPRTGVVVKLAGEVELDEDTGQLSSTFKQSPQTPFEEVELSFFGGAGGALRTPAVCGDYTTEARLVPWSAPQGGVERESDTWRIGKAPSGDCARSAAALPHAPGFAAGTVTPIAGAHSPMAIDLSREDGSQEFAAVNVSPPPGLVAKLAGTPACPEALLAAAAARSGKAEKASPSCPAVSRVGGVAAAAGAGPDPFWAHGTAYLAGPYKGAPLSLAIVTPAVAGPFDLGTIVVRTALHLDPRTARITAVSDPLPRILEGVPLDVRRILVKVDKPSFTLNPTNCDPLAFEGLLVSTLGAPVPLNNRFQVGECGRLGFKPRVALRLFGKTHRGAYQGLRAVVRPRAGDANIAGTVVRFPRSAFVAQEHIRTVCTRVQFAADACPKGSVYGRAVAWSPLLDYPLRGPVYLRSSDNELPDAVADLRGPAYQPVRVEVSVRNDSVKGALRNTVQAVPDAPVSYFRLQLFGKGKGLIVNSRNICAGPNRATMVLDAQNGKRAVLRPRAFNRRCAKKRGGKKRGGSSQRRARPGAR